MKQGFTMIDPLVNFVAVSRHGSFRAAAAELGISTSAVSQSMRGLEDRLHVRLLNRTTRQVSLTEAGETLLSRLKPAFDEINAALDDLTRWNQTPSGTLRINAPRLAATTVLAPALIEFSERCPDVTLEIIVEDGLSDIVADRFDAGIRFGETLEADMVAIKISADMEMAVVGAPSYFDQRPPPSSPQELTTHSCIQRRMRGSGKIYHWEFEKDGEEFDLAVNGGLITDDGELMLAAARSGIGLVYTGLDYVLQDIEKGYLRRVLADWCPAWPGFYLYYPNRRHIPFSLRLLINILRERANMEPIN
jgi:DNA-binding transcriptional LysR family regulator